jgi:hypothetical protein
MTTETPDPGAEIEADAPEPDTATDDTGDLDADADVVSSSGQEEDDAPPLTSEEFHAAAAELAAEAEAAADDGDQVAAADDGDQEHGDRDDAEAEPNLLDDPKVANLVAKLRKEAAEHRVAKAAVEERLQAAADTIAELQAQQENRQRRDVELEIAGKMIDPSDIWHKADLHELLHDDGDIDEAKVAQVIEDRVPEHWRVQVRHSAWNRGPTSGASRVDIRPPSSWADALSPPRE